ncbi:MAG: helical backbone metal receptor [Candidatus Acidiferrales bacterium]
MENSYARKIRIAAIALIAIFAARSAAATQTAAPQASTQIVVDETGRRVTIPTEVRRIVSLAPNLTETIYALRADSKLVGDTDYCDVPPEARTKPHVGAPLSPSLEAIVGLKPDLVLATTAINRRATVDALEHLGVAVYATNPHSVDGLLAGIENLATVIGSEQEGKDLIAHVQARLDALHAKLAGQPERRVLFVVWDDPLISVGPNTFIADALRRAGAVSVIESKQAWPQINLEEVVRLQPEYLIFAGDHGDSGALSADDLRSRPAWRELEAVKQGRIARVSGEVDRPAPGLIDAIEELAKQLHPSAFANAPAAEGSH